MTKLENRVAVITGGSGGIGKATAERFLKEGAKVALVDLSLDALENVKKELNHLGDVSVFQADVTKEEEVKKYVKGVVDRYGKIDVFFNNAGIEGSYAPITELALKDFEKTMSVNTVGVFLCLKHVLPVMLDQGSGSVINTSSVAGLSGTPNMVAYGASKHAVVGLTKTAAVEVAHKNVRVNSIHPAPINTRMMDSIEDWFVPDNKEAAKQGFASAVPLKRYGEPSEIAGLFAFLASDDSSYITGAQIRIDGGSGA